MKAKLSEFGQYVDDQLTDYVVIMVTNKKSEKQMAEDLELFLDGIENSTQFSAWLHQTIRNLVAECMLCLFHINMWYLIWFNCSFSFLATQSLTNSYKKQTSKTRNSSTNNDEVAIEIEASSLIKAFLLLYKWNFSCFCRLCFKYYENLYIKSLV